MAPQEEQVDSTVSKESQSEHRASAKARALSQLENHWNQIRKFAAVRSRQDKTHAQRIHQEMHITENPKLITGNILAQKRFVGCA
jgi:hypothetical protein